MRTRSAEGVSDPLRRPMRGSAWMLAAGLVLGAVPYYGGVVEFRRALSSLDALGSDFFFWAGAWAAPGLAFLAALVTRASVARASHAALCCAVPLGHVPAAAALAVVGLHARHLYARETDGAAVCAAPVEEGDGGACSRLRHAYYAWVGGAAVLLLLQVGWAALSLVARARVLETDAAGGGRAPLLRRPEPRGGRARGGAVGAGGRRSSPIRFGGVGSGREGSDVSGSLFSPPGIVPNDAEPESYERQYPSPNAYEAPAMDMRASYLVQGERDGAARGSPTSSGGEGTSPALPGAGSESTSVWNTVSPPEAY